MFETLPFGQPALQM